MAQEQSAYSGTGTVEVLVNVVDPATGNHSTATIDTSTTRIDGFSTVPTVTQVGTGGIYKISFSSVTPAPTEGDRLVVKVNGTLTGAASAFTEYGIPVKVIAAETSSFDAATDSVTVGTNNDKTGYSISGTKQTLDSLNDVAATDIVSNGAITTLSGAVVNVDTVDVTTTNSDMRGTDGANTVAPDNASIAAILVDTGTDIPASIAALNNFDPATDQVIVSTNNDKTGYALSSAANDAIGAAFLAYTLTKGSPGTIERAFWQSLKATQLTDGEVSGTPTASAFDTNLTAVSGAYDHLLILFTSGTLAGEARPIDSYSSTNGRITLQEPLTAAPSSADEFIIVPDHSHPVAEIVEGVWSEDQSTYTTSGSFGYYLDSQVSGISSGGGDASAANQTTIISHLTDIKGGTFSGSTDSLEAIRDRGDAAWTTGGASGSGLYQVTVTVEDASNNALQGARIAVDGTNLILTTPSNGQVTFNLDSGVYLLTCSPPAG